MYSKRLWLTEKNLLHLCTAKGSRLTKLQQFSCSHSVAAVQLQPFTLGQQMQFVCAKGLRHFYEVIKLTFIGSVYLCTGMFVD
jgi:hypothetical protein